MQRLLLTAGDLLRLSDPKNGGEVLVEIDAVTAESVQVNVTGPTHINIETETLDQRIAADARALNESEGQLVELHWPNGEVELVLAGDRCMRESREMVTVDRVEQIDPNDFDYRIEVPSDWLHHVKNI